MHLVMTCRGRFTLVSITRAIKLSILESTLYSMGVSDAATHAVVLALDFSCCYRQSAGRP